MDGASLFVNLREELLRVAVRKYRAFGGRIREINFAYFLATERP